MSEENLNKNALKIRYTRKKLLEIGAKPICKKMPDSFKAFCKSLADHPSSSYVEQQKNLQSNEWMVNPVAGMVYQPSLNEHKMFIPFQMGSHHHMYKERDYFQQRHGFVNACGIASDLQPSPCKRNKSGFWPNRFPNQHYLNKHFESNQNESVNQSRLRSKKKSEEMLSNEHISKDQYNREKSISTRAAEKEQKNIQDKDEDKENVNHGKQFETSLEDSSNEVTISEQLANQWFSKCDDEHVIKDYLDSSQSNCQLVGNNLFQSDSRQFCTGTEVLTEHTLNNISSFTTKVFGKHGTGDGFVQKETDPNDNLMSVALNNTKDHSDSSEKILVVPSETYLGHENKEINMSNSCNKNVQGDITDIMNNLRIQNQHHSGQGDSPPVCFQAEKDIYYLPLTNSMEALEQHLPEPLLNSSDYSMPTNYANIHTPEGKMESSSESPSSAESKQKKSPREIFPDLRQLQPEQKMEATSKMTPKITNPRALLMQLPFEIQMLVKNAKPSSEMLGRTEAIATLSGLKNGQMTLEHLARQLQNSALQQRHKELLACILKMCIQDPHLTGQVGPELHPSESTQKQDSPATKPGVAWFLTKVPSEHRLHPAYCQLVQSPRSGVIYPASQLLVGSCPVMPLPARIMQRNHMAHLLQEQLRQIGITQHASRSFRSEELDNFNLQPAPEDSK